MCAAGSYELDGKMPKGAESSFPPVSASAPECAETIPYCNGYGFGSALVCFVRCRKTKARFSAHGALIEPLPVS